jgi:1,2-diacylglycerol 3-alpha-glucosyltransferase
LGHDVDVVCLRADRSYGDGAYRVRLLDVPFHPIETLEDRVIAHAGLIRQRRYDLFVACMYPFFAVARRLGVPYVYYEYGVVNPVGLDEQTVRLLSRIRREGQEHQARARRVAVISRFLMSEQVNPLKHADTDVVYCGADSYGPVPMESAVLALRNDLGFGDAEVIGYFGRVERSTYKGVDELVEMVGELRRRRPRAMLMMTGYTDDHTRAHFAALPWVRVQSHIPGEEMARHFSVVDVAVSASRWEGFNLPLAEAQLYARPVVAYDLAAHPEVVAPSGVLAKDRAAFVDAMEMLLATDAGERRRRGEEARRFVEQRFTWKRTVESLAACLDAALAV